MPKSKIAKTAPPKHSEPHTVDIPTLEQWTDVTSQPPYTYIRGRVLPQYIIALMFQNLHTKGKRYIKLYIPSDVIAAAYQFNPAAFAAIIRRQSNCPFQFVTCRIERGQGRMRITASETAPQKSSNYLGTCSSLMLGEWEKNHAAGFTLVFLFHDMPRSYQNDHRVFKFRLRESLRTHTQDPTIELALQVLEAGYRVSKIPSNQ